MRGSDALRNCVSRADLKQPSSMTGTKLRKYIATVSQSAVELTKISRILMVVDEGNIAQFEGQTLDQINLNGESEIPSTRKFIT
nr:unnamed protein product [Callosobruchus chinensis]